MKHLHTLSVYFGFKTATTCCGRRVKATDLALTDDADCPECRAHAENQHAIACRMVEETQARGDLDELRSEHLANLRTLLDQGVRYRNAVLT